MKAIQMTLDEELIKAVDKAASRLKTTRSAFTRDALREALAKLDTLVLEERHRQGYQKKPVQAGEFDAWLTEQAWGE
jgi:metal-responsive CopG/Arc/MetJ family transcriptional regulator